MPALPGVMKSLPVGLRNPLANRVPHGLADDLASEFLPKADKPPERGIPSPAS
ncbi:hypothetical protein SAMN03159507_03016 [Pseudomonas sp. NFACC32-1]|nr:hypothetical protein SAMN03159507_03016 [Pseudomonas sp. NFACC32-1]SFW80955.1 hypothetical protein SAMN03159376_04041 [Pseudomonas sp. NFACC09-4]SFX45069.1 hypothetical protein SAMN03159390_01450 [Pseudomonas sp. NFACC49-2]SFX78989.1 hypothetical protein SAMN03159309_02729 [Pseudomonas sp. NFACC36]SIR96428.1 hypothetical protein SAMN05428955_0813 [Pseudomonas sp. 7SR1]